MIMTTASSLLGALGAVNPLVGQRGGSEEVLSFHSLSQNGVRFPAVQHIPQLSQATFETRNQRRRVVAPFSAARGTEGATEEERQSQSSIQTPSREMSARPLSSLTTPPSPSSVGESASSLDRIERQAKSSIDRLKHILYKLKTRPTVAETTVLTSSTDVQGSNGSLPSSLSVREDERQVFISQKIEVDLSSVGESEKPIEMNDISAGEPEAELATDSIEVSFPQMSSSLDEIALPDSFVQFDSLTCTSTTVQFDEENQTAVVTVTATVRGADLKDQKAYAEQTVAMAARALTRTCLALDEKAQLAVIGNGPMAEILPSTRQKQHDDIVRQLALGKIVSSVPVAEGRGSTPFRRVYDVRLVTEDGLEVEAVFKPVMPGDVHGRWKRAPADWVAYQMAAILGTDMVPPAVIRRDVNFGGEEFSMGVLVYKVADLTPLTKVLPKHWGEAAAPATISNAHILDALLGSAARRKEAFKAGRHWTGLGEIRPVLIEHPMGPGLGDLHSMWSQRGEMKGVKHVSPITLSRLRGLNRGVLLEALSGALSANEMELILEKRDQVVAYFDAMVSRHGRHLVIR